MTTDDGHETRHGVLQSTFDMFLDSTRAMAELATRTGTAGARAVLPGPVRASVNSMLLSLRNLVEQAPQLTDEIEVLMSELAAKRLSIQAVTAELTVLDQQLELLQRTLAPVQTWSVRWNSMQRSLMSSLDVVSQDSP